MVAHKHIIKSDRFFLVYKVYMRKEYWKVLLLSLSFIICAIFINLPNNIYCFKLNYFHMVYKNRICKEFAILQLKRCSNFDLLYTGLLLLWFMTRKTCIKFESCVLLKELIAILAVNGVIVNFRLRLLLPGFYNRNNFWDIIYIYLFNSPLKKF